MSLLTVTTSHSLTGTASKVHMALHRPHKVVIEDFNVHCYTELALFNLCFNTSEDIIFTRLTMYVCLSIGTEITESVSLMVSSTIFSPSSTPLISHSINLVLQLLWTQQVSLFILWIHIMNNSSVTDARAGITPHVYVTSQKLLCTKQDHHFSVSLPTSSLRTPTSSLS